MPKGLTPNLRPVPCEWTTCATRRMSVLTLSLRQSALRRYSPRAVGRISRIVREGIDVTLVRWIRIKVVIEVDAGDFVALDELSNDIDNVFRTAGAPGSIQSTVPIR